MKFYDDSLKDTTIEVYAFGKSEYIRYINKLKLNYDEVKDKEKPKKSSKKSE